MGVKRNPNSPPPEDRLPLAFFDDPLIDTDTAVNADEQAEQGKVINTPALKAKLDPQIRMKIKNHNEPKVRGHQRTFGSIARRK
jgi:hypothetical protein